MQTESVNNSVVVDTKVAGYKMRFDDIVTSPNYYRFELEALSVAEQDTPVEITVNTDGGSLATGIEMVNGILSCKAPVKGILRSSCHSCGSIIFLACDSHEVGIASEMLLHSGSGGVGGTPAQAMERAKSYKRQVRTLFDTVYKGFLTEEELDLMIEEDKEYIFGEEEIVSRLEKMYTYRDNKHSQALEQHFEAEMAEEDKYLDAAIHILKEEGELSEEEATRLKVISDKIDSLFSERKDDVENIFKSLSEDSVEDKSLSTFKAEPIQEDEYNSVMIWDRDDNEYGILSWKDGEGIEFELLDEDETLYQINQVFLEDLPKKELKQLSKDLGIKYSHNSKDETLAKNLVKFFEEIVEINS